MKNRFLIGALAIFALTLVCCNQQEDTSIQPDNLESIESIDGNFLKEEIMEVSMERNESSDGAQKGTEYCLYKVTSVDDGCKGLKVGDIFCYTCPDSRECKNYTRYRATLPDGSVCTGDLERVNKECKECPDGGLIGT